MALIANNSCTVALDGIGVKTARIEVGEIDISKLTPSAIEWLLNNGIADEVGETRTENSAETVVIDQEEPEIEEVIEESVNPIKAISALKTRDEIEQFGRNYGIELDKRKKPANMKADFRKQYEFKYENK